MSEKDRMRDELAKKLEIDSDGGLRPKWYEKDFKAGFDAAVSILQPKLDLAVEEIKSCIAEKYEYKWGSTKEWEQEIEAETNLALAKIKGGAK